MAWLETLDGQRGDSQGKDDTWAELHTLEPLLNVSKDSLDIFNVDRLCY